MSGWIKVDPQDLHRSAGLVRGLAEEVQAGHASADAELHAAQSGLVGLSAAAIAAKATEWKGVTQVLHGLLADHSAALSSSGLGYQETGHGNADAIADVGSQDGAAQG